MCRGGISKKAGGGRCARVAKVMCWSSGRNSGEELQSGLNQLPVIRNREGGRLRETAYTWDPMAKSIGTEINWP